jgi:hypothetical protein
MMEEPLLLVTMPGNGKETPTSRPPEGRNESGGCCRLATVGIAGRLVGRSAVRTRTFDQAVRRVEIDASKWPGSFNYGFHLPDTCN